MASPVTVDDVVQGAQKFLASKTDLVALLGSTGGAPWLFQGRLFAVLEGTQSAALVLSTLGGWGSPGDTGTAEFPRLSVELWVDPLRDSDRNYIDLTETRRRAVLILRCLDKYLHRSSHENEWWGTVRVVASQRLAEPVLYDVPDGDGLMRAQVMYAVNVFGYRAS